MSDCIPCKALAKCLQFEDFTPSQTSDKLYLSAAQSITVTCPSTETATVSLEGGVVSYVLNFEIGTPPYPNLTLNCTGGQISVPVPDNVTQADLDALINGMLQTCLQQVAKSIGCTGGVFFNTQQIYGGCSPDLLCQIITGGAPAGVFTTGGAESKVAIASGTIMSTISVNDANLKANQVLNELFATQNAECNDCSN
jgi:hypothetical protein